MRKELFLVIDYRYDEGARPRKEMICPCINSGTCGAGGEHIPSNMPLLVEKWTKSELNKRQNKDL